MLKKSVNLGGCGWISWPFLDYIDLLKMKSSELIRQILKLKYMGFSITKRLFIAKQIFNM